MDAFLSDEWLARVSACGGDVLRGVPDATFQVDVAGSPTGVRVWHLSVVGGAVAACAAGPVAEADVALTLPWDDAVAVLSGSLDANAAFMQGRIKTGGATGPLLALLAALSSADGHTCREALAADTHVDVQP